MDILSLVAQMMLSLSLLVILHECGHFFPARWFNTKVEKFYLFFNPYFSLFKKKIGDTEYGIGWLPFGGYVKIAGMIDESMDKEQLKQPAQPWEFRSKKAWQRLIIMVGGVAVNLILGFLIFGGLLYFYGKSYMPNENVSEGIFVDSLGADLGLMDGDHIKKIGAVDFERFNPGTLVEGIVINDAKTITVVRDGKTIDVPVDPKWSRILSKQGREPSNLIGIKHPIDLAKVSKKSTAEKMGLQAEDRIISINGNSTPHLYKLRKGIRQNLNQPIEITVLRGKDTLTTSATLDDKGTIGIETYGYDHYYESAYDKYTLAQAIPGGVGEGVDFLTKQLKAFGQMFKGRIKATESLGSVISITKLFDPGWNWKRFWTITAMLSILLGFFNLLPIPALDGGYIMFLIYEMITGKTPSDKFLEYATIIGFFLMVGLMIFALGLDISRLF